MTLLEQRITKLEHQVDEEVRRADSERGELLERVHRLELRWMPAVVGLQVVALLLEGLLV